MSDPKPSQEPLTPQLYCGNCGAPISPGKHFCEVCLAPASLATTTPPPAPAPETAPAAVAATTTPPTAATPVFPSGPQAPTPGAPIAPAPGVATPTTPSGPQAPTPVPAVVPVPPGAPAPEQPAVPAGRPPIVPYVPASTPPTPAVPAGPSPWWLVLMVLGAVGALIPIFLSCLLLLIAGSVDDPGTTRLVAIFCCLVPGLLMGVAAVLGGMRYFRRQ